MPARAKCKKSVFAPPHFPGAVAITAWRFKAEQAGKMSELSGSTLLHHLATIASGYVIFLAAAMLAILCTRDDMHIHALPLVMIAILFMSVPVAMCLVTIATVYGYLAGIAAWREAKRNNIKRTIKIITTILEYPSERLKAIVGYFKAQLERRLDPDRDYLRLYAIIGNPVELLRCTMPAVQIAAP